MVPNLLVATRTLFQPHRWRHSWRTRKQARKHFVRKTEHWDEPVPGAYQYVPGRGWFLVGTDASHYEEPATPEPVIYSKVLKRYLLKQDYDARKARGTIMMHEDEESDSGRISRSSFAISTRSRAPSRSQTLSTINSDAGSTLAGTATPASSIIAVKRERQPRLVAKECGFFRLDDGIAWVRCWDGSGEFLPGPYERWCIDEKTKKFRKMVKGDCPEWQSRQSSRRNTLNSNTPAQTPVTTSGSFFPSLPPPSISSSHAQGSDVATSPTLFSSSEPSPLPGRKCSHVVPVIELPSEASTRPSSPLSHHYKTPLGTPLAAPVLSDLLQQAHEQAKREEVERTRAKFES